MDSVGATLLRAANDVLATEGPAALTVRRIAAEAGVSTINVYSRFGGKDGVVDHLYVEGFRRLRKAMLAADTTDDPLDDLRRCGEGYRRFALEHPTYYAVMFDRVVEFEPSPGAVAEAAATLGLLAEHISRVIDAGRLAAADPMAVAASVWATCHGLVSLERRNVAPPGVHWDEIYATTTAALLRGLAGPAAPAAPAPSAEA